MEAQDEKVVHNPSISGITGSLVRKSKSSTDELSKLIFSRESISITNFLIDKACKSQRMQLTNSKNILDKPVNSNDSFEFKDQPKFRKGKGKLKLKSSDKDGYKDENSKPKIKSQKDPTEQRSLEAKSSNAVQKKTSEATGSTDPDILQRKNHESTSSSFADFEHVEHQPLWDGIQNCSAKPETASDNDSSSCVICHQNVAKSQLEEHRLTCLREKFTKQSDAQPLPDSKKEIHCQICKLNITNLNSRAQSKHINECLDKAEKAEDEEKRHKQLLAQAREAVLPCPLCAQKFKSQQSRMGHLKKCAKVKTMTVDQLKVLMEQQEETYVAQLEAGILPEEFKRKKTGEQAATKDSRKNQSKKILDEDTQLALALSNSLMSDENRPDDNFHQPVMQTRPKTNEEEHPEGPSIVRSLLQDKRQKAITKGKKGKQCENTYPLLVLPRETAAQRISDRVDKSIFTTVETSARPPTPPFKRASKLSSSLQLPSSADKSPDAEVEENNVERVGSGNCFWLKTAYAKLSCDFQARASSSCLSANADDLHDNVTAEAGDTMVVKQDPLQYYVKRLMPPVQPCNVPTGSKMKRISAIPGRRKSDNVDKSNWNPGPSDFSEQESPAASLTPADSSEMCPSQTVQDLAQLAMESEDTITTDAANIRIEGTLNVVGQGSDLDGGDTGDQSVAHNRSVTLNQDQRLSVGPFGENSVDIMQDPSFNDSNPATENKCNQAWDRSPVSYACMVNNNLFSDVAILAADNSPSRLQSNSSSVGNDVHTKTIRAHKIILHVQCPQLLNLCVGDYIDLSDFSEQAVLSLLMFLYTGALETICVPEYQDQLLRLAQRFSLDTLVQRVSSVCQQDLENNISSHNVQDPATTEDHPKVEKEVKYNWKFPSALCVLGASPSGDAEMEQEADLKKEEAESQSTLPESLPQSISSEKLEEYILAIADRSRSEENEHSETQFTVGMDNLTDEAGANHVPLEKPSGVENFATNTDSYNPMQVVSTSEERSSNDLKKEEVESQSTLPESLPQSILSEKLEDYMSAIAARSRSEENEHRETQFTVGMDNMTEEADENRVPPEKPSGVENFTTNTDSYNSMQVAVSTSEERSSNDSERNTLIAPDGNPTVPVPNDSERNTVIAPDGNPTVPVLYESERNLLIAPDGNPTVPVPNDSVRNTMIAPDGNPTVPVLKTPGPRGRKKRVSRKDFRLAVLNVSSGQDMEAEIVDECFTKIALKIEETMPRSMSPVFIPSVLQEESVTSDELLITSATIVTPRKKKQGQTPKKGAAALVKVNSARESFRGGEKQQPMELLQKVDNSIKFVQPLPGQNIQLNRGSHAGSNRKDFTSLQAISDSFCEGNHSLLPNPVTTSESVTANFSSDTKSNTQYDFMSDEDLFADEDESLCHQEKSLYQSYINVANQTSCCSSSIAGSKTLSAAGKRGPQLNPAQETETKSSEIPSDSSPMRFEKKANEYSNLKDAGERQTKVTLEKNPVRFQSKPTVHNNGIPQLNNTRVSNVQLSPPLSQASKKTTRKGLSKEDSPLFNFTHNLDTYEILSDMSPVKINMENADSSRLFRSLPSRINTGVNECTNLNSGRGRPAAVFEDSSVRFQSPTRELDRSSPQLDNTRVSSTQLSPPLSQTGKRRTRRGLSKKDSPFFKSVYGSESCESRSEESNHPNAVDMLSNKSDVSICAGDYPATSTDLKESKAGKDFSLSSNSSTSSYSVRIDPTHPSRRKLEMEVMASNKVDSLLEKTEQDKSPLPLRERLQLKVPFGIQPLPHLDSKSDNLKISHKPSEGTSRSRVETGSELKNYSSTQFNGLIDTIPSEDSKKHGSVHTKTAPPTVEETEGADHNLQDFLSNWDVNDPFANDNALATSDENSDANALDTSDSLMIEELKRCEQELGQVFTPKQSNCGHINRQVSSEWKEPSPFTPMAPYDSMATPALKKAVEKIGVRPIGKKRMRELLKSVYHETHQYETDSDYDSTPVKHPRIDESPHPESQVIEHGLNLTREDRDIGTSMPPNLLFGNRPNVPSSSVLRNENLVHEAPEDDNLPLTQDSSGSDAPDLPEESILQGWPEEEEDTAATQMTQTTEEKMADQLIEFVHANHDIYEEILMYKPLELDVLKKRISDAGIRVSMPKVMDFLDERCITFTMKNMSSRNNRNQKQCKKKSNQVGKNGKAS